MERIVLIVAYVLAGLSALIVFSALASAISVAIGRWKGGDRGVSFVPLVSLVLAGLSCLLGYRHLWFWPLIISLFDPGTWLTFYLPWAIRRMYVKAQEEKDKDKSKHADDR